MPFSFRLLRRGRRHKSAAGNDPCSLMPPEMWTKVFSFNSFSDIRSLTLVCHTFRLIGQPFLFETLTIHPYFTGTRVSSTQQRGKRMMQRLQFFQSAHIKPAVKECRLAPSESDKYILSLSAMDNIIDVVFDALPGFPNLTTLVCHSVYFSYRRLTILRVLNIKVITLHSCFSDVRTSPDFLEAPFESVTLRYPKKSTGSSVDPHFLSLFLHSRRLRLLFAGPTDEIIDAMILARPLSTLSVLDIPIACVGSPHFVQALSASRALEALSLHSLQPNEEFPTLSPVPDDFLPNLISYRGPNKYIPSFSTGSSSLKAIEVSIVCETEHLVKTFDELHGRTHLRSLIIRVSTVSSALLHGIHSSFPSLLTLIIKEPFLIPATWSSVFASCSTHPCLRSLIFPVFVSDPNNFWKPPAFEINDTLSFFAKLYPQFLLAYPCLQRIQIVYNERGISLLWVRRTLDAPLQPHHEDVRVDVDALSSSSEGRPLCSDEIKRLQAIRRR